MKNKQDSDVEMRKQLFMFEYEQLVEKYGIKLEPYIYMQKAADTILSRAKLRYVKTEDWKSENLSVYRSRNTERQEYCSSDNTDNENDL